MCAFVFVCVGGVNSELADDEVNRMTASEREKERGREKERESVGQTERERVKKKEREWERNQRESLDIYMVRIVV